MPRKILGDRKKKSDDLGFTRATVYAKDAVYVMSFNEQLGDERESTVFLQKWSGTWGHLVIDWPCIALCSADMEIKRSIFVLGLGGRVWLGTSKAIFEENVDTSTDGPPYRGMLRDIRIIGKHAYVAGIGRQVYRRDGPDKWKRIDKGMVVPKGNARGTGFNSIDGFAEDDIYAVGGKGEIWHYDGKAWDELDSPTNLVLERVICAPDGKVYVCGQAGVLVRGRDTSWETVEHDATEDDLWGMTWFEDKLWVATVEDVYSLEKDDSLKRSDMGGKPKLTCGWLDANDGVMWSVGEEDLAYTDGKGWYEVIVG